MRGTVHSARAQHLVHRALSRCRRVVAFGSSAAAACSAATPWSVCPSRPGNSPRVECHGGHAAGGPASAAVLRRRAPRPGARRRRPTPPVQVAGRSPQRHRAATLGGSRSSMARAGRALPARRASASPAARAGPTPPRGQRAPRVVLGPRRVALVEEQVPTGGDAGGGSCAAGTRDGIRGRAIFCRAWVSRFAAVAFGSSSTRATSAVVSPHGMRRAGATWMSRASAGWQQVNTLRSKSSSASSSRTSSRPCRAAWSQPQPPSGAGRLRGRPPPRPP